jgi:hypothetical protein
MEKRHCRSFRGNKRTRLWQNIELYKPGLATQTFRQIMKASHEYDTIVRKQGLGSSAILSFNHGKMEPMIHFSCG